MNCDTFEDDARSASQDNAMPTLRRRMISSAEFYRMRGSVEEIKPLVERVFPELIDELMRPLTPEETRTQQQPAETDGPPMITITGDSYETAFEEFNRVYLDKCWGDGLPLVPPTPERVKWMLTGTNRSPSEVLGTVNPKQGVATIEKIAINAVMAGAKPEYLPVIIAAMEALTDADYDDLHILASAGSFSLMIVVSGPIVKELKMYGGIGFLGHGWRPNNTIGRAVRLSTLNTGRTWPAKNDMGLIGRISAHTFYTFPENTDMSVWEPYHTYRGFKADDSCVTVASIHGSGPLEHFYGGMIGTWTADGILDNLVKDIIRSNRNSMGRWGEKGVGAFPGSGGAPLNHMVVVFPELVSEFRKMGYNQVSLQNEVYQKATVPFEELKDNEVQSIRTAMITGNIPKDRKAIFEAALKPGARVPVLITPENIHFFVTGGAPGCAFSFNYYRIPPYNRTAILTKKIKGATLTKAGTN
jgi:hypothetical protein